MNQSDTIECLTILNPDASETIEGVEISRGMTLLLLPGEVFEIDFGEVIMARPKV